MDRSVQVSVSHNMFPVCVAAAKRLHSFFPFLDAVGYYMLELRVPDLELANQTSGC